jgi:hypothetical protein
VLSASLRSRRAGRRGSEAVALRHPVKPVANGLSDPELFVPFSYPVWPHPENPKPRMCLGHNGDVSTVMISPAGSALEETNSCTMPGVLEVKKGNP